MVAVELHPRDCGAHVVVALRGELDAVDVSDVCAAVSAMAAGGRCVVVDLAGLGFMDCAALSELRRVQELARQAGGELLLAAPRGIVLRLLTLTELFPAYASVAAAVSAACDRSARYATERPAFSAARPGRAAPLGTGPGISQ
jgi:anti-sigma B factor antagonist